MSTVSRTAMWDRYAETVVSFSDGRVLAGRADAIALPWPQPVHVITACNPGSQPASELVNEKANESLRAILVDSGYRTWDAVGRARDGAWSEESLAVPGLDRHEAASIGLLFGQLAIFELTNEELRVIECLTEDVVREGPRC